MKLPSMTRDMFKSKQAILFEVGRISSDIFLVYSVLLAMWFLIFFISEDVLLCIYLNMTFFHFLQTVGVIY